MRFVSTRGQSSPVSISDALQAGLAPDGGLYVPEFFPQFTAADFEGLHSFPEIACRALAPFFSGDALAPSLRKICESAFSFPIGLKPLRDTTSVLELFHGPSAAFKDFGARFLAECLSRQGQRQDRQLERTILVATSGDTGGAVAAAFHRKPGVKVVILFPKDGVSPRQRQQLCGWRDNVRAIAVQGSFDDCQRLVKTALMDAGLQRLRLASANSINIGRLLPQLTYYVAASVWYYSEHEKRPAFSIPSGNIGNAVAALWAKRMGLPIRHVAMATNANRAVVDYFETGEWRPRPSVATLANAMDVGNPSNMERVLHLYPSDSHESNELPNELNNDLSHDVSALSVSDEQIRKTISEGEKNWQEIWCPHTATAVHLREAQETPDWIIVATAHPAKFDSIVEPLIGHPVRVPPQLAALLTRPSEFTEIAPEFDAFRKQLNS